MEAYLALIIFVDFRTVCIIKKYNSNADIFYHLSFSRKNSKKNSKEKRTNVTYLAADVITLMILGTDPRIFISGRDFSMSEWNTAFFYDVNFLNYLRSLCILLSKLSNSSTY